MEEATEVCSNCDKAIAASKLNLHEAYCARNMKKCDICKEVFPKGEIEEHKETHKKKPCCHCA